MTVTMTVCVPDVPFQYPMWVSFGFNTERAADPSTPNSVSVPYVGELRIQYVSAD